MSICSIFDQTDVTSEHSSTWRCVCAHLVKLCVLTQGSNVLQHMWHTPDKDLTKSLPASCAVHAGVLVDSGSAGGPVPQCGGRPAALLRRDHAAAHPHPRQQRGPPYHQATGMDVFVICCLHVAALLGLESFYALAAAHASNHICQALGPNAACLCMSEHNGSSLCTAHTKHVSHEHFAACFTLLCTDPCHLW
jgi:hypothetical protein